MAQKCQFLHHITPTVNAEISLRKLTMSHGINSIVNDDTVHHNW